MKKILSLAIVFLLLAGCKSKSADEYFSDAEKFIAEENYTEAIITLQKLSEEFPDSPKAPEALSRLASLYHNKVVTNLSERESLQKAAGLYQTLYDKYPDSELAPVSLFMAGFLYANDLKNFDQATKMYNQFLNRFPSHELASSAREELEMMGLTPEEILQKKIARDM